MSVIVVVKVDRNPEYLVRSLPDAGLAGVVIDAHTVHVTELNGSDPRDVCYELMSYSDRFGCQSAIVEGAAELELGLAWFELTDAEMAFASGTGPTTFATGFDRVLAYAADSLARPHDPVPRDLLALECREMAGQLEKISAEDGDPNFTGRVLELLVRRIAEQERSNAVKGMDE